MSIDTVIHPAPSTSDAIAELRSDHLRIERVLADCERLVVSDDGTCHSTSTSSSTSSSADRSGMVARLGALLQAHMDVKHAIFEPALRQASLQNPAAAADGSGHAGQAGHAHADGHNDILARLAALAAAEQRPGQFAVALKTFAGAWRQHVREEEAHAFPEAQRAADAQQLDLMAMGAAIAQRRGAVLGDQGVD
jgi:hypothetical protein